MPIYLTNIASMQAMRALNSATSSLDTAMRRLSTGKRINSAKDDPAGLQIANRMTSEINGLKQANRNTSDGIAFAQTYEGALDETVNLLQKIRTIAVQASTGTYTQEDRDAMQVEVNQLSEEITRIAEQTKYGGHTILVGKDSTYLKDGMMTIQVGAYNGDTVTMDLTQSFRLQDIFDATGSQDQVVDNGHIQLDTVDKAQTALANIDSMIKVVDDKRTMLGAYQNRFESTIRVNSNVYTNLSDARSRIEDADYAEESANYIRASIMQQASLAILMQANARPNLILQLIGSTSGRAF